MANVIREREFCLEIAVSDKATNLNENTEAIRQVRGGNNENELKYHRDDARPPVENGKRNFENDDYIIYGTLNDTNLLEANMPRSEIVVTKINKRNSVKDIT
ncbi:hypothetical protein HHI36_021381 [Cryptolaemus montrouzieri]|uniref:Uncharacterized protein n=1 Tax=Cryptolaemus montrouzieri TaxID=559131 RepID=A0ABD2MWL8_9CUCU